MDGRFRRENDALASASEMTIEMSAFCLAPLGRPSVIKSTIRTAA